jgi:hypothetical protein
MQDDKEFQDYIETLPPELKQAINSVDYAQKLQEIVKNNKLMIDQAGKLEAETTLVIAGIEPLDKYLKNLVTNVGLSKIQASVVAHDVNELIFKNIRESLKKINDYLLEEDKALEEKQNELKNQTTEKETPKIEDVQKEMSDMGIELRENTLPEIAPKIDVPMTQNNTQKIVEPIHENIPPVKNIVETKMTENITIPKKDVIVEEKSKLPNKFQPNTNQPSSEKKGGDPYREPII